MSVGQGSISVHQKKEITAGPPFLPAAAENGVSIDPISGKIVLGNNAAGVSAQLLSNREIPMGGFEIHFNGATFETFIRDFSVEMFGASSDLYVDDTFFWAVNAFNVFQNNGVWAQNNAGIIGAGFGDYLAGGNNTISMNIENGVFDNATLRKGVGRYISLEFITDVFAFGDLDAVGNGHYLKIDNTNNEWGLGQRAAVTNLLFHFPTAGIGLAYFDEAGNNPFLIPTNGSNGNTFLTSPDFGTGITLEHAASGAKAIIGDIANATTGLILSADVPNSEIVMNDGAGNAAVRINTVLGFTGIVAPVNTITVDGGIVTNVA